MKCPKCDSEMEQVHIEGVEVDRCVSCKGLWFDRREETVLKPHAEEVDIGDPAVGAKFNAENQIKCPVCEDTVLLRMMGPRRSNIWFETCPSCYGLFYDAGEFKDTGKPSAISVIREMYAKAHK